MTGYIQSTETKKPYNQDSSVHQVYYSESKEKDFNKQKVNEFVTTKTALQENFF